MQRFRPAGSCGRHPFPRGMGRCVLPGRPRAGDGWQRVELARVVAGSWGKAIRPMEGRSRELVAQPASPHVRAGQ